MAITLNTKPILDKPRFRALSSQPSTSYTASSGAGSTAICCDLRSRGYADPHLWALVASSTIFQNYNTRNDGWKNLQFSATIGGTLSGGTGWQFVPSQGPSGTITSGATTTSVVLSTALPAAVEVNQLANRGDGLGYIIRIVDNASGASGKIEERRIVGNTAGTTPTIYLDTALTFTPTNGSRYEMLSGALYVLSTGASKEWRRHDIATGATSSALSTTNLPGTVGTSYTDLVTLDEQHVPITRYPGEGFVVDASAVYDNTAGWVKKCLTATATAAGTITGQAAGGDAALLANQYRNFQIRIVEDTSAPTAVGQRRRITSHTAGASAVYTLASNWTVTPSATCKFVIENDNDKIIFLTNSTTVYNYNITANTWDTSTWAARGTAASNGLGSFQAFGLVDSLNNIRHSYIYSLRAVGTGGNPVDVLDIAGASTGSWSSFALTPNYTTQITTVTSGGAMYDPLSNEGRYMYFLGTASTNVGPLNIFRLDLKTKQCQAFTTIPTVGAAVTDGILNKFGLANLTEGSTSLSFLFVRRPSSGGGELYECALII